ncbi:tripartite tricarboxylate transporter substrate binding protein [Psychromarinibacter sp. C21-152]|uniref:Tripartite tricarboxylate transporter substrate binding protein n=1 Tax=Psychromarinibacter sediminicola TaxID=3033385 RepID=A0AAE3NTF6_9RHOB|nr:tripartite tricarboxylate transporter substrate binding protein [Psychromarinibacter sediminicola]MDF0603223.1 tripartite tricarboxylate transporter substrate binding protein [Psychromarinibacter sediminicola]
MTAPQSIAIAAMMAVLAGPVAAQDSEYSWQPDRPINIIVPWSAGGSTDQVTRVIAPILEEALGTEIVVVNQPGASGSTGTKAALDAPRDGYTWTANAIANNATYTVTGLIDDTSIEDYRIYLHVANVPLVSVNVNTEYQDFPSLLDAMKNGEVTVGTAGVNSSGGMALAALRQEADGELAGARMITYDGGNPAVIAAASGEVDATTQLAVEQTEMIRAGRLRSLTVFSDTPLEVEGIDPVPPITDFMPDFHVAKDYFGVFIPKGAPEEVYETVDQVWKDHVMNAPELQEYANDRGAIFDPSYGEDALAKAMPVVIAEACARVERGEAVVDPSEIGIDCETGAAE